MADINFKDAGVSLAALKLNRDYKASGGEIEHFSRRWFDTNIDRLTQEYEDKVFEAFMALRRR